MDIFSSNANFLTPKLASIWASEYLHKNVTTNNIIYLINYGKIANHSKNPKENLIDKQELKAYYDNLYKSNTLNHPLSFANFKEAETTKHIHRLHPYKGKFIPQLVEYFLDSHTDSLKAEACFQKNDIVLDPFCGSGTTLCVANELQMHSIGIELSSFNAMLCNAKVTRYSLEILHDELERLNLKLESFYNNSNIPIFEKKLNLHLSDFNAKYFPKDFKRKVVLKEIDEKTYGTQKEMEFLCIYENLIKEFAINMSTNMQGNFFDKWYIDSIKQELVLLKNEINQAPSELRDILSIILSRTARSCRATTHADLATLKEPISQTYYCKKHGRICKPIFSITKWFKNYSKDTLKRLKEFDSLRSECFTLCLNANSCNVDIISEVSKKNEKFAKLLQSQKVAGIFSSPPYVGLIDYHEQHAYSYDILGLQRQDNYEIGAKANGQNKAAQENYTQSIACVLKNVKHTLKQDYNVFLVANDKFNLYPKIAELAGMRIIKKYDRPVLNRSEKDMNKYNESIFWLKEQQ